MKYLLAMLCVLALAGCVQSDGAAPVPTGDLAASQTKAERNERALKVAMFTSLAQRARDGEFATYKQAIDAWAAELHTARRGAYEGTEKAFDALAKPNGKYSAAACAAAFTQMAAGVKGAGR